MDLRIPKPVGVLDQCTLQLEGTPELVLINSTRLLINPNHQETITFYYLVVLLRGRWNVSSL